MYHFSTLRIANIHCCSFHTMDENLYNDIVVYKSLNELPTVFPSTKSNFIALSKKFAINEAHKLTRDGKLVLVESDLPSNLFTLI